MILSERRILFTRNIGLLLVWCHNQGFAVAVNEVMRSDEQAEINAIGSAGRAALIDYLLVGKYTMLAEKIRNNAGSGIRNTLHSKGLAADLLLYVGGAYQSTGAGYLPIGAFWKTLHPDNRHGADWGDYGHFSMETDGIK